MANKANRHFAPETPLWFNLSHSGDDIALLLSDEGEVGCDIEVIRPRANWRWLANAVFSLGNTLKWTPCILISNWNVLAHLDAQRSHR